MSLHLRFSVDHFSFRVSGLVSLPATIEASSTKLAFPRELFLKAGCNENKRAVHNCNSDAQYEG